MLNKLGTVGVPQNCKKGFVWKPDVPPARGTLAKGSIARATVTREVNVQPAKASQAIVSLVRPVKLEATRQRPGHPGSQSGEIIAQTQRNTAIPKRPGHALPNVGKTTMG